MYMNWVLEETSKRVTTVTQQTARVCSIWNTVQMSYKIITEVKGQPGKLNKDVYTLQIVVRIPSLLNRSTSYV